MFIHCQNDQNSDRFHRLSASIERNATMPVKRNTEVMGGVIGSLKGDFSRRGFMKIASATAAFTGAGQLTNGWAQTVGTIPLTGANQPMQPGSGFQISTSDQVLALLAWTPDSGDSKYFRSRVPLASRIPAFAATQAHPKLSTQPQLGTLTDYYIGTDFEGIRQRVRYGNTSVPVYVSSFAQYQDVIGGWNGAQTLPTASYVDAAHRNGTLILGILYQPMFPDFIQQAGDGSFPVGDKLVEMAKYFGYDGYFLNVEEYLPSDQAALLAKMMLAMKAKAKASGMTHFYLQYYDAMLPDGSLNYQGQINEQNGPWLNGDTSDSIYIDYGWSGYSGDGCCGSFGDAATDVAETAAYCKANKYDPFTAAYFGLLTGNDLTTVGQYSPFVIPANGAGTPQGSISSFVHGRRLVTNTVAAAGTGATNAALRKILDQSDRTFWSGATGNPAQENVTQYGIANFIAERSVIGAFPFISRFNVGTGTQFFLGGNAASALPWFNIGIQDLLPTWQFWTKSLHSAAIPDGLLQASFDYATAYNGGSSVKVTGQLGAANPTELRLFKTRLPLDAGGSGRERLELVFRVTQGDAKSVQAGLIFADNPSMAEWLGGAADGGPCVAHTDANGWTTLRYELDRYAGRTVAAISLGFQAVKTGTVPFTVNIGELRMLNATCGVTPPSKPNGFAIDNSYPSSTGTTAELLLSWQFDSSVWYYDIYREKSSLIDQRGVIQYDLEWLGRIYDEVYYVESLSRLGKEKTSTLQLVAVAHDGSVSAPAKERYSWA